MPDDDAIGNKKVKLQKSKVWKAARRQAEDPGKAHIGPIFSGSRKLGSALNGDQDAPFTNVLRQGRAKTIADGICVGEDDDAVAAQPFDQWLLVVEKDLVLGIV